MVRSELQVRARLFLRELLAQEGTGNDLPPTVQTIAHSIDMDERESARVMGWLSGQQLVREAAESDQVYDRHSTARLAATPRGQDFAESGALAKGHGLDWLTAVDNMFKML